ncbi:hypothetical protein ACIPEN_13700 [Herbaspirillum chlorophenolicum]|uniref:Uncharacterized protein n=2 Tax=Herbaspirillum chlorophenolicum TaxID=211589 RepID=A0ABW8F0V0_9BURK
MKWAANPVLTGGLNAGRAGYDDSAVRIRTEGIQALSTSRKESALRRHKAGERAYWWTCGEHNTEMRKTMKINKLLAAVLVAAFALPVMAQPAPAPAPAPAAEAPAAKPAPKHKKHAKKHKKHKKHAKKAKPAMPINKGA